MNTSTDGRIQLYPIDGDKPDSESIVRWLNEFAIDFGRSPEIRQFTELAMPPFLLNNDIAGQIRACTQFVKDFVTFVADPEGTEFVQSPVGMFEKIFTQGGPGRAMGDCDDHCLLLASMLRSLGIENRIVGVKQSPASTYFDHVIVEVLPSLDGRPNIITIDPCAKTAMAPVYRERLYA